MGAKGARRLSAEFGISARKEAGFQLVLPSPGEAPCGFVEGLLSLEEGERDVRRHLSDSAKALVILNVSS